VTDPEYAETEFTEPFIPNTYIADDDQPSVANGECRQKGGTGPGRGAVKVCERGSVENPTRTIVLTGGSHAMSWYPALELMGEWEHWKIVVFSKSSCRLARGESEGKREGTGEAGCREWNDGAMALIKEMRPDAVFTMGTSTRPDEPETITEGQVEAWRELGEEDIPVIVIRDNPRFTEPRPVCIDNHGGDPEPCGGVMTDHLEAVSPYDGAQLPDNVVPLDLTEVFCQDGFCPAVVGNVLVYRDSNHMSATYARTTTVPLREAMVEGAPWLF
jgi:hypothetical protein